MDLAKSEIPSPAPDDLTEIIQHNDPSFRVITKTSHRFPDAALAMTLAGITMPEFVTNTTGAETIQTWGPAEIRSTTRWQGQSLITEWKMPLRGTLVMGGTWRRSLSDGGGTQVLDISARDFKSGQGKARIILARAPLASKPNFSGEWTMDKAASSHGAEELTEVIAHQEPLITIKVTEKWPSREPVSYEVALTTEGVERTNRAGGNEFIATTRWEDDGKLVTVVKDGRGQQFIEVRSLSEEARTQTVIGYHGAARDKPHFTRTMIKR